MQKNDGFMRSLLEYSKKAAAVSCRVMSCMMAAVSCIGVDYGYTDEGSGAPEGFGTSEIRFGFNWQEDASGETAQPDNMSVIMARLVSEIHYFWNVTDDGMQPGSDTPMSAVVRHGDYCAAAFYVPQDVFTVNGLDGFRSNSHFPMYSVTASLPVMGASDLKDRFGVAADELGYEYQVIGDAQPLWHAASEVSCGSGSGQAQLLEFEPSDLTVEFGFSVKFRLTSGASVSSVTAALAGVPASVSLMTGEVNDGALRKAVFSMTETPESTGQTAGFAGKVRTLGAFSSGWSYLAGPGVVWLVIDAASGSVTRRLYTGVNIGSRITGSHIMEETGNGYKVVKNHVDIDLGTFTIDGGKLVSGDNAVDEWSN